MSTQCSFFEGSKKFSFDKPIRLIELFAGYGFRNNANGALLSRFWAIIMLPFPKKCNLKSLL